MNYYPVHTNITPNYNFLSAENAYLKQDIEFKNAVLIEQESTINKLKADVGQLSQANMMFRADCDKFRHDAKRWEAMKKIIEMQGGKDHAEQVQQIVDKDIQKNGASVRHSTLHGNARPAV